MSKAGVTSAALAGCLLWMAAGMGAETGQTQPPASPTVQTSETDPPATYMGKEVCRACHAPRYEELLEDKHGQVADPRTPFAQKGCETCHGPGSNHVAHGGGRGAGGLHVFGEDARTPPAEQNAICLSCHQGGHRIDWQGSTHEAEGLVCSSCHKVHQPNPALDWTTQAEVCYRCHRDIRALSYQAYGHPIREHKVICSDCHNAHGSTDSALLKRNSLNEVCYTCHAEKRGPFLWEHPPAVEDCTLCHNPHGSLQPASLVARPPQLCQRCHATSELGLAHTRQAYSFGNSGPETSNARFVLAGSCLNCHSQVHGSNHPSGVDLMR